MKRNAFALGFTDVAFVALLACGCSGSSSSSSLKDCADAGAIDGSCDRIASDIKANGGTAGTCTNPSAKFAKACAALQACAQCVGVDSGL